MQHRDDKKKIITEFEMMQGFELSARDVYSKVSSNVELGEEGVRTALGNIAKDEQRHAGIVQEIIDIAKNAL
jgi:rubrerythrin